MEEDKVRETKGLILKEWSIQARDVEDESYTPIEDTSNLTPSTKHREESAIYNIYFTGNAGKGSMLFEPHKIILTGDTEEFFRIKKVIYFLKRTFILSQSGILYYWNGPMFDLNAIQTEKNNMKWRDEVILFEGMERVKIGKLEDVSCHKNLLVLVDKKGLSYLCTAREGLKDPKISGFKLDLQFLRKDLKIKRGEAMSLIITKMSGFEKTKVIEVSCGNAHTLLLSNSGFVYSFGVGTNGRLGHGNKQSLICPTLIKALLKVKIQRIATGGAHSLVLGSNRDSGGSKQFQFHNMQKAIMTTYDTEKTMVYSWGCGNDGRLGHGNFQDQALPHLVEDIAHLDFTKICCGFLHSACLSNNGLLFTFGYNEFGQLGSGEQVNKSIPFNVSEYIQEEFLDISCGGFHTFAQPANSLKLLSWGLANHGQLGIGGEDLACLPTPCELRINLGVEMALAQIDLFAGPDATFFTQKISQLSPGLGGEYGEESMDRRGFILSSGDSRNNRKSTHRTLDQGGASSPSNAAINVDYSHNASRDSSSIIIPKMRSTSSPGDHADKYKLGGLSASPDRSLILLTSDRTQQDLLVYGQGQYLPTHQTTLNYTNYHSNLEEIECLMEFLALSGASQLPDGLKGRLNLMSFRPKNLPRKSAEEERKHRRLVELNRKLYLSKVKQKEKEMKATESKKLARERRISDLKKIWEDDILPIWEDVKHSSRVVNLWREGLPPALRGKIWMKALGNQTCITQTLFDIFVKKAKRIKGLLARRSELEDLIIRESGNLNVSNECNVVNEDQNRESERIKEVVFPHMTGAPETPNLESSMQSNHVYEMEEEMKELRLLLEECECEDNKEGSISSIKYDLPRTFPHLAFFREGGGERETLEQVLGAFAISRPDVGYVQGMSYLAGMLLLVMLPFPAYVSINSLISSWSLFPFFKSQEGQINRRFQIFRQIFNHNLPQLCHHFELQDILPNIYLVEWFMTLFVRPLDLNIASRIWDLYMLDGDIILYRTAVAILTILNPILIKRSFEGIILILKDLPKYIKDEELLVKHIYAVQFPQWVLEELPKLINEYVPT